MQELCSWLNEQNGGVRTYIEFHKRAQANARQDKDNAAILALLGRVAARFAARYEGEPLPVEKANAAVEEFRTLVARAAEVTAQDPEARLAFANEVAIIDIGVDAKPH